MNLKLKIKTFGWRNALLDQISRIEDGFRELGHEIVDQNPDIIYCNNDFYDEPLEYSKRYPSAKKIFNVLDLQIGNPLYDLNKLDNQLKQADFVTCISDFVKNDIKNFLKIDAINIGNPIKDIIYNPNIIKTVDYLIVGRNRDNNKRAYIFEDLLKLNESQNRIYGVVGPEPLPSSTRGWLGILNDSDLSEVYNLSKYVICCSLREGLNLVIGEACQASIPLIASDMTTCLEWNMPEFVVQPNSLSIAKKILEIESQGYNKYLDISLDYGRKWHKRLNKKQIAKNILQVLHD